MTRYIQSPILILGDKMRKKTQEKMFDENVFFRIDRKLLDRLDAFAKERGWKRSFVIREAIKKYLKKEAK